MRTFFIIPPLFTEGSEDMSHIRVVEIQHDSNGSLGLSIAGGVGSSIGDTPIIVANLTPGGSAERSQKLKVGLNYNMSGAC